MIKNIIFDFDGVIVDSEVLASKAFAKYFSKIDYAIKEEQFYKYAGNKTVDVIDLLSAKYNLLLFCNLVHHKNILFIFLIYLIDYKLIFFW